MEILELLKRAKLHEWCEEKTIRLVPGNTPIGTRTFVAFEFENAEDAQKLIELFQQLGRRQMKIQIRKSPTADTRTCDFANTTKETLLASSHQHIQDVGVAMAHFAIMLCNHAEVHDHDKISDIDGFHRDFLTGFKEHSWWDNHRKVNRHHLLQADGVPQDVNLIDVLDMVADCVMAGMARSGSVYALDIKPEVLMAAFQNTVELLKNNVEVVES